MASETERRVQVVMCWGETPESSVLVPEGGRVMLGSSASTFLVPESLLASRAVLVERDGDADVVHAPPGATLRAWEDGALCASSEESALRSVPLRDATKVEVTLGALRFFVERVDVPIETPRAALATTGWSWMAASLGVHAAVVGIMALVPPNAGALSIDLRDRDTRYIAARLDALSREAPALESPAPSSDAASGGGAPGAAAPSGAAGHVDETRATGGGARTTRRASRDDEPIGRERAAAAGAIGAIASFVAGFQSAPSPFGGASAAMQADTDAYGALTGPAGFSNGTGGFDMRGAGRGTGCPLGTECGAGTIAQGALGTYGAGGSGTTCTEEQFQGIAASEGRSAAVARCGLGGHGYGASSGTFANRTSRVPTVAAGQALVVGSLSHEHIRRIVARNRNQLRHCYEQALQSRPGLEGRLNVQWTIQPDGRVSNASVGSGSDIAHAPLAECVTRSISRLHFGAVNHVAIINYPFTFSSPD